MALLQKIALRAILVICLGGNAATQNAGAPAPVAVAPQYDTTHVYVPPQDVDAFVTSFLGTFGGKSTKQVVVTVTPTPSKTTSQALQTPVGTVSLFGFMTPIPSPFGSERNGYLVSNMDMAIASAQAAGAAVIVAPFSDPIGLDAIIQWPGGVNMQLYWHTTAPSYAPFQHVPENRVYVSQDRVGAFQQSFLKFSHGMVTADDDHAPGIEVGQPAITVRRIRIESAFGKMVVYVTNGHLPYPYGRENTGYEVDDLDATLAKAKKLGVTILVAPYKSDHRRSAIVQFPGGYVAEIHARSPKAGMRYKTYAHSRWRPMTSRFAIRSLGEQLAADENEHNSALFRAEVEGVQRNLHPILRDEVYRIASEALRNAFRHSRARQIEVELRYDETQFQLRIRDDGKGVGQNIGGTGYAGHFGLSRMRERAKVVGGKLTVWSEFDSGTEVELCIPATVAYVTPSRRWWLSEKFLGRETETETKS